MFLFDFTENPNSNITWLKLLCINDILEILRSGGKIKHGSELKPPPNFCGVFFVVEQADIRHRLLNHSATGFHPNTEATQTAAKAKSSCSRLHTQIQTKRCVNSYNSTKDRSYSLLQMAFSWCRVAVLLCLVVLSAAVAVVAQNNGKWVKWDELNL